MTSVRFFRNYTLSWSIPGATRSKVPTEAVLTECSYTVVAGMPLCRTTPHVEQHSSTPCFLLIANRLHVSKQEKSDYVTKLCSTFYMTFWVTANLQRIGYPMKILRCNNGTTMQSHRPCWNGTKGNVMNFLDKSSLWTKPELARINQTWNANQMNGSILILLVQRKWALHNVLWGWCSLWHMTLMG